MQAIVKTIKSNFKIFAGLAFLIPLFLSFGVVGKILLTEVNQAYSERLQAGLSTFEIILDQKLAIVNRELSRVAADDALKVTLALDMHAQLRHYLVEEFDGSGLDFIQIFMPSGEQLLSQVESGAGVAPPSATCIQDFRVLAVDAGRVFLKRQFNVVREGEVLAVLCGGIELGSRESLAYLRKTLGADPFLINEGSLLLLDNDLNLALPADLKSRKLFSPEINSGRTFAMINLLEEKAEDVGVGLIIEKHQVRDHAIKVFQLLIIALLVIGTAAYFAVRNYTMQRRVKGELHKANELASVTLSSIGDSVITTDTKGWVKYTNNAAMQLTGFSAEEMQGKPWNSNIKLIEMSGSGEMDPVLASISLKRTIRSTSDINLLSRNNQTAVQYIVAPIFDQGAVSGSVVILHDSSRERQLREKLVKQVNTDLLTGLMSRSAFGSEVEAALNDARYSENQHAVMFLDLDRFKVVNDACGHHAGDLLLKQVSTIFGRVLRDGDALARLGGDEFGILLKNMTPQNVLAVAEKLLVEVNNFRFIHEEKPFAIGVSVGATMLDSDSDSSENVFRQADAACFAAKDQGRNRVEMYVTDGLEKPEKLEIEWAPKIRDALRNDRMFLYVQPMRPTKANHRREAGIFEVLIRMMDDNLDVILPGVFLPVAERYGLMPDIDRWVIESVFRDDVLSFITRAGEQNDTLSLMSINVSSASISQPDFLTFVLSKIQEYGVCPDNICFELSETTIAAHIDEAEQFINELSALGCRFMIDDVGVGMSSFTHIKHLNVDFLKIDGSAIKNTNTDAVDRALVKAVIEIARAMQIMTVAEFVETDEIATSLGQLGVDYLQGYAVGTPFPIEDFRQRMLRIVA